MGEGVVGFLGVRDGEMLAGFVDGWGGGDDFGDTVPLLLETLAVANGREGDFRGGEEGCMLAKFTDSSV
tara:strand:+ start:203 stop:409 length:207 start_codon:yes stop_codon:yes gene_type:complete